MEINDKNVEDTFGLIVEELTKIETGEIIDKKTIRENLSLILEVIKDLKIKNYKFEINYLFMKLLNYLFYSEASYYENFNEFLDSYIKEIKFERNALTELRNFVNKIKSTKDYNNLALSFALLVPLSSLQIVRNECSLSHIDILVNSAKYISYYPGTDISLAPQEFLEVITENLKLLHKK